MFSFYKGKTPIEKELPKTAATTYNVGDALVYGDAGTIVKATGTTKPEFICSGVNSDSVIGQVIEEDMEFATVLSAAGTSLKLGNKVTIHTDGAKVTATTTNGVAELVEIHGTASGDEVIVKF